MSAVDHLPLEEVLVPIVAGKPLPPLQGDIEPKGNLDSIVPCDWQVIMWRGKGKTEWERAVIAVLDDVGSTERFLPKGTKAALMGEPVVAAISQKVLSTGKNPVAEFYEYLGRTLALAESDADKVDVQAWAEMVTRTLCIELMTWVDALGLGTDA